MAAAGAGAAVGIVAVQITSIQSLTYTTEGSGNQLHHLHLRTLESSGQKS